MGVNMSIKWQGLWTIPHTWSIPHSRVVGTSNINSVIYRYSVYRFSGLYQFSAQKVGDRAWSHRNSQVIYVDLVHWLSWLKYMMLGRNNNTILLAERTRISVIALWQVYTRSDPWSPTGCQHLHQQEDDHQQDFLHGTRPVVLWTWAREAEVSGILFSPSWILCEQHQANFYIQHHTLWSLGVIFRGSDRSRQHQVRSQTQIHSVGIYNWKSA